MDPLQLEEADQMMKKGNPFLRGFKQKQGYSRAGKFQGQAGEASTATYIQKIEALPRRPDPEGREGIDKVLDDNIPIMGNRGKLMDLIPAFKLVEIGYELDYLGFGER
jgi:hypothetical protein